MALKWRFEDIFNYMKIQVEDLGRDLGRLFNINLFIVFGVGVAIFVLVKNREWRVVLAFIVVLMYAHIKKYRSGYHRHRIRERYKQKGKELLSERGD